MSERRWLAISRVAFIAHPSSFIAGFCLTVCIAWFTAIGCSAPAAAEPKQAAEHEAKAGGRDAPPELPGIHNLMRVTERIYSGSEPEGEAAFAALAKLGVRTIASVDGARPDLELARKHGLRYVHIPIGYDGLPAEACKSLTRLVREVEGPIYIHCHHGQHRGPAAAAAAAVASRGLATDEAVKVLQRAGTGKGYAGLWRDVAAFVPPAADVPLPELVEEAQVDSFAAAMAKLDRHFDHLRACGAAGWATPKDHPDLVPAQEALMVREGLREAARLLDESHGEQFRAWLSASESSAAELEAALKQDDKSQAAAAMQSLETSCKRCHATYRDTAHSQ